MISPTEVIRPTEVTKESLTVLLAAMDAVDTQLTITPTGAGTTPEEVLAYANHTDGGFAAAMTASNAETLAQVNAIKAALVPGPLGDGLLGKALDTEVEALLTACGYNPGAVSVAGQPGVTLPTELFVGMCYGLAALQRARAIVDYVNDI